MIGTSAERSLRHAIVAGATFALVAAVAPAAVPAAAAGAQTVGGSAAGPSSAAQPGEAPAPPTGLQVDGWSDGGTVGDQSPTLSWVVNDPDRGDGQAAYQVSVIGASGRAVWDSGKVRSDRSVHVPYEGPPLTSDWQYAWAVRVWDKGGAASPWSRSVRFDTGLLKPGDWSASWLQPSEGALVRRDFTVGKPVARAFLYVAAQGIFEPHLDGRVVGDHVRDSTWTDWKARTLYRSFDVTDDLQPGAHTLGAMVSQGGVRFGAEPVRFIAQLNIDYTDGSTAVVGSDDGWRSAAGPVTAADPYLGERYDARKESPGWDSPHFDDASWQPARVVAPATATSTDLALGKPVSALDSTECCGWSKPALVDGIDVSEDGAQGYHSGLGTRPDDRKWVQVDLGSSQPIHAVTLYPARPTNDPAGDVAGVGFPVRYRVEASDDPTFATATTIAERTGTDQPNPGSQPVKVPADVTARYVRLTATKLSQHSGNYTLRLAEMGVQGAAGKPAFTLTTLAADPTPPMRVVRTVAPITSRSPKPGVQLYDFGQNFAGWVRVSGSAPAGTTLDVFKGEMLDDSGRVTTRNISFSDGEAPRQTDHYTFRGHGRETYEPHFVYSGFRYAEVSGLPAGASVTVEARVVHSDVGTTGKFHSSDDLLNRIQGAVLQTQLNNLHGLPEDCPTREKRGWLGDAQGTSAEAMANFGMDGLYRKWLDDVATSQNDDGSVPAVAPSTQFPGVYKTDPAWGTAYPTVLWDHWLRYGDPAVLRQHYDGIRRWVEYLATIADSDHIVVHPPVSYGADWQSVESTPPAFFQTGFYYRDTQTLADVARILGKTQDVAKYGALADDIAAGLNKRFYQADTGTYANGSQLAQALPLTLGIVPKGGEGKVVDALVLDIAEHQFHLTTGFVGTQPLFRALDAYGRNDVALKIAERDDYPSFGYMVNQGPGTIWEKWPNSKAGDGTSSKDHIGLGGAIGEWFYTGLAGIKPQSAGYRTFSLSPSPVGDLTSASGRVATPHGDITSAWRRDGDRLDYRATVPNGTTATVTLPLIGGRGSLVKESGRAIFVAGQPASADKALTVEGSTDQTVTLRAGAGSYHFEVRPAGPADTQLSITADQRLTVDGGDDASSTAVVASRSNREATGLVSVWAPSGWRASADPSSFAVHASGEPEATRVQVPISVPADAAPGDYPVVVSASVPGADPVEATTTVHVGKVLRDWSFNEEGNTEGWQAANQLTDPVVSGGELHTTATGGDPFLVQAGPLDISATEGVTIRITLTASQNGSGQLFWTTAADTGFSESRSGRFGIVAGERKTYTAQIPAGASPITSLRLDPQEGTGPVSIDKIRLIS